MPLGRLEIALLVATAGAVVAFAVSAVVGFDAEGTGGVRAAAPVPGPPTWDPPIRVEVLNGAGRPGLARTVTEHLRTQGFDVVYFGNAQRFGHERSVVIDRAGAAARARAAAAAMGIDTVHRELRPGLHLDATVVVGEDWEPAEAPRDARAREWLDRLRGLLPSRGERD